MRSYGTWQYCKFKQPPPYKRVEIMDENEKKYFGFYDNKNKIWLESNGKNIINNAWKWRYLPSPTATVDSWSTASLFPAFGRMATWYDMKMNV